MRLGITSNGVFSRRLVLLAPSGSNTSGFCKTEGDSHKHRSLMSAAQRLRANVYLEINAVERSQLSPDGRHVQAQDDHAWHLLSVTGESDVAACVRYNPYENSVSYSDLGVSHSALAKCATWGAKLRTAVEGEIGSARRRQLGYAELGGWAIAPALRCGTEALRMMLAAYALSAKLGGALCITTAKRTCSAPILRRVGGQPIAVDGCELPAYYDDNYKCELEVIRFDSSRPNPKFRSSINDLSSILSSVPVISADARVHARPASRSFAPMPLARAMAASC
jgi:hypothetical protein